MYEMYFDGGAEPNPGKAGAGAVIYKDNTEIYCIAVFVGEKETNNTAEYTGLIKGLELALNNNIDSLIVKGDSELIIKQLNKEYKVKAENLKLLFNEAEILIKKFKNIEFKHVKRNLNKRADELSRIARDDKQLKDSKYNKV